MLQLAEGFRDMGLVKNVRQKCLEQRPMLFVPPCIILGAIQKIPGYSTLRKIQDLLVFQGIWTIAPDTPLREFLPGLAGFKVMIPPDDHKILSSAIPDLADWVTTHVGQDGAYCLATGIMPNYMAPRIDRGVFTEITPEKEITLDVLKISVLVLTLESSVDFWSGKTETLPGLKLRRPKVFP